VKPFRGSRDMTETDVLAEATATYRLATGGIHPQEAAQIDGIAFSQ